MATSQALNTRQLLRAALLVLFGFLVSGVLGLVRTAALTATFGTSDALDAFYVAQRLPEALFVLVAGGALGSAFIPVFSGALARDQDEAWRLASAVMTLSALVAGGVALVLALLAPWLVPTLLAPGRPVDVQQLAVRLTQLMLITPLVFSVSGLLMGILNTFQVFLLPALAASMYNVGLIVGAVGLSRWLPPTADGTPNIYGAALGAVLGALLHMAVQWPGLRQVGPRLRASLAWNAPGVRQVLALMGPRMLGLGVVQLNFMVNVRLSFSMTAGSTTALTTAWQLMFFALGVLAQSVGTALFPTLAALANAATLDAFRDRLAGAVRSVLFLSLPATVVLILLGRPAVALLERGAWDAVSTDATAWALAFFALGMAGHALLEVLSRAFYALSDTWTPVLVGVGSVLVNIVLSLLLIRLVGTPGSLARGPFAGLALANSLATLAEGALLWWLMRRRLGGLHDRALFSALARTALACGAMALVILGVGSLLRFPEDTAALLRATTAGAAGGAAFFAVAALLRLDEARTVPGMLVARLRRGR